MVDLAVRSWPDRPLAAFELLRGGQPVIAGEPFTVNGRRRDGATLDLWIAYANRALAMTGEATFGSLRAAGRQRGEERGLPSDRGPLPPSQTPFRPASLERRPALVRQGNDSWNAPRPARAPV
jgi:hypothetical protein